MNDIMMTTHIQLICIFLYISLLNPSFTEYELYAYPHVLGCVHHIVGNVLALTTVATVGNDLSASVGIGWLFSRHISIVTFRTQGRTY